MSRPRRALIRAAEKRARKAGRRRARGNRAARRAADKAQLAATKDRSEWARKTAKVTDA